jgi:hypothetical protein
MHGFIAHMPFDELINHAKGFLASFQELKDSSDLSSEELFLLRCMCKDIFCCLTGEFDTGDYISSPVIKSEKEVGNLFALAQRAASLFRVEMENEEPEWMPERQAYMRIQMLMYRLKIAFEYFSVKRRNDCDSNGEFPGSESLIDTVRSIFDEFHSVISHYPRIRPLVDRAQLLGNSSFNESSTAVPPPPKNESEWMLWQPSLLARYNYEYQLLFSPNSVKRSRKSSPFEVLEKGISICQQISWGHNDTNKYKMNSLSSLRSLLIAFWLETGSQDYSEGIL